MASALSLTGIELTFGGDPLFEGVDFDVADGDRIALVGRNGTGKSTLLKIAAGLIEADAGERFAHPGIVARYLPQEPDPSGFATVIDFAAAALAPDASRHIVEAMLETLGLELGADPAQLSGGELRRAALVQALAGEPDVLLLDEPTNHLDLPAILWLEETLKSMRAACVVISHDRRFLERVTTKTVWIDRGRARSLSRGFAHFEDWRDQVLAEEESDRHKLGRKIAAEEDWMRYGVTARRKRNMRRVGELQAMRRDLREARRPTGSVNFSLAQADAAGKRAIVAKAITKSFGGVKIIDRFSTEIARGDRIGLVGPNGAGKTTLVRMLIGELAPDEGVVELGANLQILSLDQKRESLDPAMRVADAITDGRGDWVTIGERKLHAATYLKDFLFGPEQWRAPVSALSGGERARLALAAALSKPSNLLVLDEPTNDLDLETLDLLEETLSQYEGILLLISHDRSFIDRLVTSVITTDPEEPCVWRRYAGGFDDMVAQRGGAPGAAISAKREKTPKPRVSAASKPASSSVQKLSYKEKYALETLPGEISRLEAEIAELNKALAQPDLYAKNPERFAASAAALDKAKAALDAAEEQWLELEMKRDALSS